MKKSSLVLVSILFGGISSAQAAGDQSGIIVWNTFYQQLVSAFKIDSAQTNTTGGQVSAVKKSSSESKISSYLQQKTNMKMAEAKQRFAYETGQGYSACMISVGMSDISKAGLEQAGYQRAIADRDSAWLAEGGGHSNDTIGSIIALRQEVYCSEDEKARLGGYCKNGHNGFSAGNTDASIWLAKRAYGGEEAMTAFDYIDTVAPLPTVPTRDDAKTSTSTALQRAAAIRQGLLLNGARTAFQNIVLDGMSGTSATE